MASKLTKDGHIDQRFKKSTSGCFLYFGILIILLLGAVFVIEQMGYTEQFVGNIKYLYESGWLEIGGYTLLGIFLLFFCWMVYTYDAVAKELKKKNVNAVKIEKEETVNVSSNSTTKQLVNSMPFFYRFFGVCVLSFILTLAVGIYLEKEWVVLKDIQNFVKNL